jgi:hypothetical protein
MQLMDELLSAWRVMRHRVSAAASADRTGSGAPVEQAKSVSAAARTAQRRNMTNLFQFLVQRTCLISGAEQVAI